MKLKYLIVPATSICLLFSGSISAKKPEGKGNPHGRPDARWENSNRQSDEYSLRGQERAAERHRLKEGKKYKHNKDKKHKYKKNKHRDDDRYEDKRDRYENRRYNDERDDRKEFDRYQRQRYEEKYRNNPVDSVLDRNINDAKSKVDNVHRRAKEAIDNKTRELTGVETRRERVQPTKPWWSFFGDE